MPTKDLGLPCPPLGLAGAPGLQGCGQGLRPSGWPLMKRGLGREPGGQPSPWAFLWGPSQLGGVMKGLGATPPQCPRGCPGGTLPLLLLLPSPCPPQFPSSEGPEDRVLTETLAHPCPSPSASFLFILGIRAAPAHMKSEVRAGLLGPVHQLSVPMHSPRDDTVSQGLLLCRAVTRGAGYPSLLQDPPLAAWCPRDGQQGSGAAHSGSAGEGCKHAPSALSSPTSSFQVRHQVLPREEETETPQVRLLYAEKVPAPGPLPGCSGPGPQVSNGHGRLSRLGTAAEMR